jgi:DNA transformation protein and related proteins
MAVSPEYREYVLEQLERIGPVRAKRMFGGVGLYCEDLFFALLDDDRLFFKVDDANRADYEARGLHPFDPFQDGVHLMQYYEVPAEVVEDPDELRVWMDKALAVARRKKSGASTKSRAGKGKRP